MDRITAASEPAASDAAHSGDGEQAADPQRRAPDRTGGSTKDTAGSGSETAEAGEDHPFHGLHSGHKLAKRYRLEECITRLDGFSSWRAVDEKLRRAVGVHVLPAHHPRASAVLDAARSAALLGDPRFVQVLDADRHGELVHVIHEWLPDATPLSTLLHSAPLSPHDAAALLRQVAESMAAAHRSGLAHLRLTPATVLRSGAGPFRIRGLAVDAALRGITHEHPERADTEAVGALLYAALTQRWPYPDGAYGLRGVAGLERGSRDSLATPEQVRAGVHRGLSDLAMRALINDGATAASEQPPCVTAAELVDAASRLPKIPPPEPSPDLLAGYQPTSYHRGSFRAGGHTAADPAPVASSAPPALPGRTGAVLKWGVSALLIAALGLGSWQIADTLMGGDNSSTSDTTPPPDEDPEGTDDDSGGGESAGGSGAALPVVDIIDFDPFGANGAQNPEAAPNAIDGDPETFWHTKNYFGPNFGNLKAGTGLILDLGESQEVSSVTVDALGSTSVELHAAPADSEGRPDSLEGFEQVDQGTGENLALTPEEPVDTRYLLVWLTELPPGNDGNYRGRITNIDVSG